MAKLFLNSEDWRWKQLSPKNEGFPMQHGDDCSMEKFLYFKLVFLFRLASLFLTEPSKYALFLRTSPHHEGKK